MKKLVMTWDEIKTRARDGASASILADLNGIASQTFNKLVDEYEKETGDKIVFRRPDKQENHNSKKAKIRHEEVVELAKQGLKASQIAQKMGVTEQCVYGHISRATRDGILPKKEKSEPKDTTDHMADEVRKDIDAMIVAYTASVNKLEDRIAKEKSILADWERLKKIAGGGS